MSVMDLINGFRQGHGKTQQEQMIPNDPTLPAGATNPGNNTVPGAATPRSDGSTLAIPATGTGEASPLANYGDLWDKKDTDAVSPAWKAPLQPNAEAVFNAAKSSDFTAKISPELIQKAASGDGNALMAVIKEATQQGYAQSALSTTEIVNTALERVNQKYETEIIPAILRKNNISNQVKAEIPFSENPAVAPVFNMLKDQLTTKYPKASPKEISVLAQDYLSQMSETIVTSSGRQVTDVPKPVPGARSDTDWGKFFDQE